jgi:hypothetical protein
MNGAGTRNGRAEASAPVTLHTVEDSVFAAETENRLLVEYLWSKGNARY